MAHMQRTVHAETMADLQYWLNKLGVLVGGQAPRGMSCTYIEPWTLAGTVMPGAAAHIAWHAAPANEVEAKAREDLLLALLEKGMLHQGQDQAAHMLGTAGDTQRPDDYKRIGEIRDVRKRTAGFKAGEHWFHSDLGSTIQQLGLVGASLVGIVKAIVPAQQWAAIMAAPIVDPESGQQIRWSTLDGDEVPLTVGVALTEILPGAMAHDSAYHAVSKAARAALAAGTLTDVHAIEWPAGYGDQ